MKPSTKEGKDVALTTRQVKAPAAKLATDKIAKIITTRTVKVKK